MKTKLVIVIALLITSVNLLFSENEKTTFDRYGLFVNYGILSNSASFSSLPGVPNCCPEFRNGNAYSAYFGGTYEKNWDKFSIEGNVGMDLINGRFQSEEDVVLSVNNIPVKGIFEHIIDYNLSGINLSASFRYNFYNNISISGKIGAVAYLGSHFNQFERISSPAGRVTFLDSNGNSTGKSVRNELSGDIPNLNSIRLNTQIGLGYDFFVFPDRTWVVRPELSAGLFLGNMVKDLDWSTSSIRFGITVLYSDQNYTPEITDTNSESKLNSDYDLYLNQLNELRKKDSLAEIANQIAEEKLKNEQIEKDRLRREIAYKDSLLLASAREAEKQRIIESERDAFNKSIQEQNLLSGKSCKCYVIMFSSTPDKQLAESLKTQLIAKGFEGVKITVFNEPYLKTKYYRLQSNCYEDHLKAFDDRIKSMNLFESFGLNPQIICNR